MWLDCKFIKHISLMIFTTFFIALPLFSLKFRYTVFDSVFHHHPKLPAQKLMRAENDVRITQAQEYINKYMEKQQSILPSTGRPTDVGISVITVSRNRHKFDNYEPKYLTQVIATFLRLLNSNKDLLLSYKLFMCNVDDEPRSYMEAKTLSKIIHTFNRFDNRSSKAQLSDGERFEKEKEDYIFCGEELFKQNVSNVLLVEDDALPREDTLTVLDFKLHSIGLHQNTISNLMYVKLYHPDRLLGYISFEAERLPELFSLSLILSTLLLKVYITMRPLQARHQKWIWLIFFIYSCLLVLAFGRQNFLAIRRLSKHLYQLTPSPSCCTPANMYTKPGFHTMVTYLKSVKCRKGFKKDTAIDVIRRESNMKALMLQPNLFTHIGMYSSIENSVLDPFIIY